ncbi:ectoine synthase [Cohnella rhizosphaerae]|uniref:L-ectoine synthase n=1 Tax=Cohnella rhizosphaerae TaxID=1457232 RepID=A0A9X4KRY3_9BACL|nr:ectoine synthase [Cohnella rhizosphaerae]MDG0809131.1 ectoine synthase [Cohnella rhizosphaerae]
MIVKHVSDIVGTKNEVDTPTWDSRRLIVRSDGIGFSLNHTVIKPGTETQIWYKNHVEAVYCMDGEGEIEVIGGETYPIRPGTLYVLNGHEKHLLRAKSAMTMLCVFDPPLSGTEVHDADGVYPIAQD